MQTPGEEVVGEYLRCIGNCEFVEYNLYTEEVQGEIDVVGVNSKNKKVFVCEVATHLQTGLRYTKNGKSDNIARFCKKLRKNIAYAQKRFPEYEHDFSIWSPIVRIPGEQAKHNPMRDLIDIRDIMQRDLGVDINLVINEAYLARLNELRSYAGQQTQAFQSTILRLFQIEEFAKKHCSKLKSKAQPYVSTKNLNTARG
tara:strand:- start:1921 stop:2517 length:597 start_codon:yes stop_codon:yes gene_type:complete